jgi:GH43 family beta-xylosidase
MPTKYLETTMTTFLRRCVAGSLLGSLLCCSLVMAAEPTFHNPLVRQRADPQVTLQSDGYYYFTATVPEYDRIEVRRTRSLDDLGKADAKVVWTKHASGPMSFHIWAPEMHRIDGKWYIYFTAGRADAPWEIRLYVLENASPNPLEGTFSLDATTFAHKGKRYLVWTQRRPEPELKATNIYIAQMDTPTSIIGKPVMLSTPQFDWEKVKFLVNEAPAALVKNDKVFITLSASATDASYCLGLLTAKADSNLLDPASWTKSVDPVFKTSEKNRQYGPGHNSFTTTPDGKTDILVYHARDYRDIVGDSLHDPNRHTRAQVIHWRADGTPDFGEPVAD